MQNKKTIGLVICFVVVALISFYAGKSVGAKNVSSLAQNAGGFTRNGMGGGQRAMRGGGFVGGQIIAKDATSITVQLNTPASGPNGQNGAGQTQGTGSKIVFYTGSTNIMKTTDGTVDDLAIGKQVSITGTANPDGSVNAQSIQIRPTPAPKQ